MHQNKFEDFTVKYQPETLDDFFNSEQAMSIIRKLTAANKLPHNILLWGPIGSGKTTVAKILAKRNGGQIHEFGTFSYRNSRLEEIFYKKPRATLCGDRLYIWDEAHTMSPSIQGGLLKLLEFPHNHIYNYVLTSKPEKLNQALVDRCDVFHLTLFNEETMGKFISHITSKEDIELLNNEVDEIIDLAEGSPRDALKIMQRIIHLK